MMMWNGKTKEIAHEGMEQLSPEQKEFSDKSNKETMDEVKSFFHSFNKKHEEKKPKIPEKSEKILFIEDIKYLDDNTIANTDFKSEGNVMNYSEEELQQINETDPGYVNGQVLDYDNVRARENNTYKETGLHMGAINWGDYATKEGVEYIQLDEGKILSRWGNDEGTFMSDVGVDYDALELPIAEEKNKQSFYKVLKPFSVEISKVAKQPWNQEGKEVEKQGEGKVLQYRTPMPIYQLVKEGYLDKERIEK